MLAFGSSAERSKYYRIDNPYRKGLPLKLTSHFKVFCQIQENGIPKFVLNLAFNLKSRFNEVATSDGSVIK